MTTQVKYIVYGLVIFGVIFISRSVSAQCTETQIITDGSDQECPAIYGDKIVWQDIRNGNWDIYMYDLSTSTKTQITTDGSWQISPAIYGNNIVWIDDRNGNGDIYMCAGGL